MDATVNAAMVKGMRLPIPRISLISALCVVTKIAPAHMNKVIFINA